MDSAVSAGIGNAGAWCAVPDLDYTSGLHRNEHLPIFFSGKPWPSSAGGCRNACFFRSAEGSDERKIRPLMSTKAPPLRTAEERTCSQPHFGSHRRVPRPCLFHETETRPIRYLPARRSVRPGHQQLRRRSQKRHPAFARRAGLGLYRKVTLHHPYTRSGQPAAPFIKGVLMP